MFSEKLGLEAGWNCHISLSSDDCVLESRPASLLQQLHDCTDDRLHVSFDVDTSASVTYTAKLQEVARQSGRKQGDLGKRRYCLSLATCS